MGLEIGFRVVRCKETLYTGTGAYFGLSVKIMVGETEVKLAETKKLVK